MANIRADYIRIILMEANACQTLDIPALELLMTACIIGDEQTVRLQAAPTRTTRAAQAARFIMRKHDFATRRQESENSHA